MKRFVWAINFALLVMAGMAEAKVNVLTTTSDVADLVKSVGKENVDVTLLVKGSQDPHFLEAKPSFMVSAAKADLLVFVGLDLEVGWLPAVLKGARNPRIMSGAEGSLELGKFTNPLDVPKGEISRSQGDVHPDGNPHFMLDPVRVADLAPIVAERLAKLDPAHAESFNSNAAAFKTGLLGKFSAWQARVKATGIKEVITYHKTLDYFLTAFGLTVAGQLEPKPGVPPSANHIMELTALVKSKGIPLIMVENFFDGGPAEKIRQVVPAVSIVVVPVAVGGSPEAQSLEQLYEVLVSALEKKNVGRTN